MTELFDKDINFHAVSQKDLTYVFQAKIAEDYIDSKVENRLIELQKKASMKGFRPGKVPLAYLKNLHGRILKKETAQEVIEETVSKILEQNKIRPFTQPKLEEVNDVLGKGILMQVHVIALPEIQQDNFSEVCLYRLQADITAEDLQNSKRKLQVAKLSWETCTGINKLKVEIEDLVDIQVESWVNGNRCPDLDAERLTMIVGNKDLDDKIDQALLNRKLKEKFTVNTVVNDHMTIDERWLDKNIKCDITVLDIKRPMTKEKKIIEIKDRSDALMAALNIKNTEDFQKFIRAQAESYVESIRSLYLRRQILDYLHGKHEFKVPEMLLKQEMDHLKRQMNQENIPLAEKKKLMEQIPDIAARRVKLGMVLADIADHNKIGMTQQEFEIVVRHASKQYNIDINTILNNSDLCHRIQSPIIEDKTIMFILSKVKYQDLPVLYSDLFQIETYCHQESSENMPWLKGQTHKTVSRQEPRPQQVTKTGPKTVSKSNAQTGQKTDGKTVGGGKNKNK